MYYGDWPKDCLDHKNMDRTDNRITNLRECSNAENQRNRGKQANNTSGHKGVSWAKNVNKWKSEITVGGQYKYLGIFDTIEDAAKAYNDAALAYHKEFAFIEKHQGCDFSESDFDSHDDLTYAESVYNPEANEGPL